MSYGEDLVYTLVEASKVWKKLPKAELTGDKVVNVIKQTSTVRAPTKETLSLRSYTAQCKMNRLRRHACKLFQSKELAEIVQKIEVEVEKRRINIRKDIAMHQDLGKNMTLGSII